MSLKLRTVLTVMISIALAAPLLTLSAPAASASELTVPHDQLVPLIPRVDFPDILDGDVYAIEEIDNWIVAGGDFTQVQLSTGLIIDQPYLVAFDKDTGELVDTFLPELNGTVKAISRGASRGEILVGGSFSVINNRGRKKLAKLNSDGSVDPTWIANANATVDDINLTDTGRLFVGGAFSKIDGLFIGNLAEIDITTGNVNPAFTFDFTGEGSAFSGGQSTRHVEALPGTNELLVVHSAEFIDGQQRLGAAMFNVSDPSAPFLTTYSINAFFDGARWGAHATNADLSPDGSFYAMATGIGDTAPWHDMVLAFPTAGGADTAPKWIHRMRDSVFAIGISNNAVYAGGHFCNIDAGPGPTVDDNDVGAVCTGDRSVGAWRWQLAALDVNDGTPLDWDPGTNAGRGVQELTVTDRGLLIGHDGSEVGRRNVGRSAFMDFGAAALDNTVPTIAITSPAADSLNQNPLVVTGVASDDTRVLSVKVRVQDNLTGLWLQADGSLASTVYDFSTQPVSYPGEAFDWQFALNAPDGQFRIEARSIDSAGLTSIKSQISVGVGVPAPPSCSVVRKVDDSARVGWSAIHGEDTYTVRRDGSFLTTVAGGQLSFTDTTTVPGSTHTYVVRSKQSGVVTEVACGSVTLDPPPAPTCTVLLEADNDIVVDWSSIAGEDTYSVRRNGSFLTSVSNLTYYVDNDRTAGSFTYVVRSTLNGVTTDVACGSATIAPPPAPSCTAVVNPNGDVDVIWTAIAGEDAYYVRRDGNFLASVGASTSYIDLAPTAGSHAYTIRSFQNGVTSNVDCGTVVI